MACVDRSDMRSACHARAVMKGVVRVCTVGIKQYAFTYSGNRTKNENGATTST